MKVLFTVIAVIAGLVSVAGQYNSCTKDGNYYNEGTKTWHDTYCQLYEVCEGGQWVVKVCPSGQLFNTANLDCLVPSSDQLAFATSFCVMWPICNNGGNYPDTCCSRYLSCVDRLFVRNTCPVNQVFDRSSRSCVPDNGQCKDHHLCDARTVPTSIPQPDHTAGHRDWKCTLGPLADDVCKFTMAGFAGNLSCALGTEFNQTLCGCQHSQRCYKPIVDSSTGLGPKDLSDFCLSSYQTAFDNGDRQAKSFKTNTFFGPVIRTNAKFVTGEAILVPNTGSELYTFYYEGNQLMAPFTMLTLFKINDQTPFDLVTNGSPEDNDQRCHPTLKISVNPRYGQLEISVMARSGEFPNVTDTLNLQSNVDTNNYIALFVYLDHHDHRLKAKLYENRGSGPGGAVNAGEAVGNEILGGSLDVSKCGFTIGYNMNGIISQWVMYEGCTEPEKAFFSG